MNPIVITHALIQAVLVKRRTERMPEAAGLHGWIDGHEHDPAMDSQPLRLVLLGDSSAAGLGVDHNLEGLVRPHCSWRSDVAPRSRGRCERWVG